MDAVLQAVGRWRELGAEARLESRRLFHGRGQCYAGLGHVLVDWFEPVLLVTLYDDWDDLEAFLRAVESDFPNVVVQRRHLAGAPVEILRGEIPRDHRAREGELEFRLNLHANQNHGFFLDMRPGRDWLRDKADGMRVLNLFSYTCALSVVALAAGARSVANLDMAKGALTVGRENHRLNFDDAVVRRASFLPHDLFRTWGRLRRLGPFDLIVVDPPSRQPGSFVAEKDYPRVLRRLPELLADHSDARILACLNAPEIGVNFLPDTVREHATELTLEERLPADESFPESDQERSLKAMVFRRA